MTAVDYVRRVFTLDVRSLALMRIAVAATVLVDLAKRAVLATDHYSDDGVLPREVARSVSWLADVSLLSLSGSPVWVAAVFVAAGALAVCVLVGWRTRVTTLLLWLVVLGIQHRNAMIWDHRDVLFACSLMFGVLLPWGAAFSLDARREGPPADPRHGGATAAAYVVQIACIYLFAVLLKDGPEWRSDLTAVERAVSIEYWARPFARVLLEHPVLAQLLTAATLVLELAIAPLLLSPWRTGALRWVAVAGIAALQLGFAVFLWLDTFPMIATAMTLGLIPWASGRPGTAPPVEPTRWVRVAATVILGYTLALNALSLTGDDPPAWPRRPAELLGVPQSWSMFAPSPSRLDGWFVVLARRPDGTAVDLLGERIPDGARPASLRAGIRTTRELVYMRRLLSAENLTLDSFLAARCRSAEPPPSSVALYFTPIRSGREEPRELLAERACR